jgi:phage-related minor tail protein
VASDTSLVFNLVARDQASEALGRMKEKFTTAATAVSAGVATAFGAGVAGALDLSAAGDKLQAQLGITPAKANDLSKVAAKVYANNWGENIGQVDEAIKGVYQQIGDVSKVRGGLQGVTSDVLALSETFDQDLGGVTNAVGQMLKTGLAKDAGQALDILTKGFQNGADKAGDLLDTVNEYGTQWRKFGLDGQTAMGLLSQGLKGGARDADLVADAVKEFSIRAVDGSKTTATGFKMIGLNANQMAEQIGKGGKGATQGLDTVLDRLRGIKDPVKQAQAATALFGTQAEDLGKALYSLDPSTAVQALGKVGGAADQMAKTVSNNPSAALETFKRQAQMKLAAVAGNFVQFAMQNATVVKPLAAALGTIALVITAIRLGQMAWTAATTAWSAVTTIATGVQWLWNAALAASPVTWIVIGIIALVAIIVLIATKTTWFQQIWHAAWGAITSAASATWGWIKKHWPLILGILTGPIGLATLYVVNHWNNIVGFFTKMPGRISKASAGMWDGIKNAFRSAINWIISGWNGLHFGIPRINTHIPGVGTVGGGSFGVPQIPYLAKGGHITDGGMAVVGDAGPEALYLPRGATVQPLTRGGVGGHIVVEVLLPGESDLLRANRKLVRVYGRGKVDVAFGTPGS